MAQAGNAYVRGGVFFISIGLDGVRERWTGLCPARSDGQPIDLKYARWIATEMQRLYDSGEWCPTKDGMPKFAMPVTAVSPAPANAAVPAIPPAAPVPRRAGRPRGRPRGEPKKPVVCYFAADLLAVIAAEQARLSALVGFDVSQSDTIRAMLTAHRPSIRKG